MVEAIRVSHDIAAMVPIAFLMVILALSSTMWEQDVLASSSNNDDDNDEEDNDSNEENNDENNEEDSQISETPSAPVTEFVPETCFTLPIQECNEVNANFTTTETFSPRCQVTLADGQLITIYKEPTKTCSTSQEELGGYTYQRYQEEAMQEFNNDLNESVDRLFDPQTPGEKLDELLGLN